MSLAGVSDELGGLLGLDTAGGLSRASRAVGINPETLIKMPNSTGINASGQGVPLYRTMGELVREAMGLEKGNAVRGYIEDLLVDHLSEFGQGMKNLALDSGMQTEMPESVLRHTIFGMEQDTSEAGKASVSRARESLNNTTRRTTQEVIGSGSQAGGRLPRSLEGVLGTTGGRRGVYVLGAMAAGALIHTIRKRDHTIDDIQGPEHMPGGNPYTEMRETNVAMPQRPPSQGDPFANHGTTYEVRARGGRNDKSFLQDLLNLTGAQGAVENRYDAPDPFGGKSQRDRILQEYR
jgi:hypothetical protein